MYYSDKLDKLKEIFSTDNVQLKEDALLVDGHSYPIVDDVIILIEPDKYSKKLKQIIKTRDHQQNNTNGENFAEDIQYTFGSEWQEYSDILPEHRKEFEQYFDLVNLNDLANQTVCDLGCGSGRWSYFLHDKCANVLMLDFSDAIFVARNNLRQAENCLFFMGDIKSLPFKKDFVDFLFCIGVLHHLPTPCLEEVKALRKYSPKLLIYLYYALDNRPFYFRIILKVVSGIRWLVSKIRNKTFRKVFSFLGAVLLYLPLVWLGKLFNLFGKGKFIPLYEAYNGKSLSRIQQDVYDRFFTRIEQRVSRRQIQALQGYFSQVKVSEQEPYWHFVCDK